MTDQQHSHRDQRYHQHDQRSHQQHQDRRQSGHPEVQRREFLWRERVKLELQVQALLARVAAPQSQLAAPETKTGGTDCALRSGPLAVSTRRATVSL